MNPYGSVFISSRKLIRSESLRNPKTNLVTRGLLLPLDWKVEGFELTWLTWLLTTTKSIRRLKSIRKVFFTSFISQLNMIPFMFVFNYSFWTYSLILVSSSLASGSTVSFIALIHKQIDSVPSTNFIQRNQNIPYSRPPSVFGYFKPCIDARMLISIEWQQYCYCLLQYCYCFYSMLINQVNETRFVRFDSRQGARYGLI